MKWEADLNGDGRKEMMLSRKDEYEADIKGNEVPGWFIFIAKPTEFAASKGTQDDGENALGVGDLPMIDLAACYVGMVAEIGKHGLVTQQIDNPRVGDPIARIFVYTIDGDHLVRTKLAEYNPMLPNALYDAYLKDGKRTVITPVEVAN
jgi:hypothetical protein